MQILNIRWIFTGVGMRGITWIPAVHCSLFSYSGAHNMTSLHCKITGLVAWKDLVIQTREHLGKKGSNS